MTSRTKIVAAIVVIVSAIVVAPLVQLGFDWSEVRKYEIAVGTSMTPEPPGSDWIEWRDENGSITARYVFPQGPGASAGIEPGDQFYMLDYQQYFDAEGLARAIEGSRPGDSKTFLINREDETMERRVTMVRHPTFMYPTSNAIWKFSLWGFTLGAFFHILGLFIAGPLAAHSKKARFEFLLIAVSSLWIIGNLLRLLSVELFGAPGSDTAYETFFEALTFVGLTGWVGFPLLLLRRVVVETCDGVSSTWLDGLLWLTPVLLMGAFLYIATFGHLGPIILDGLLVPIVYYAACYVAAAAFLVFLSNMWQKVPAETFLATWGRTGSLLMLAVTVITALAVRGWLPLPGELDSSLSTWLIVGAQLLAIIPVTLTTLGTLRLGKVDDVLTRAFVYVLVLGTLFIAFIGGLGLIDAVVNATGASRGIVEGFYVVVLLILFERGARRLRVFASTFFSTDRNDVRIRLGRFQHDLTEYVDTESLANRAVLELGEAFKASSAVLFLPRPEDGSEWVTARYNPEPPYFTEQIFKTVWPHFQAEPRIWALNPELNENPLPGRMSLLMQEHRSALAVPIRREGQANGLLVLGRKSTPRGSFNLDDLERLRAISGPLSLGVDRLALVERERQLAAENTNAKLEALRAQINPHFLFNALNTILSLIAETPEQAERVVEDLASIFRRTLQIGSEAFVSLSDELALVERYLRIEQARFGDRLQTEIRIDPAVKSCPVPAFAVQTIVENAVKHGLEKRRETGTLLINCKPGENGESIVLVEDSGIGIPELFGKLEFTTDPGQFFGIGLGNVSSRLERLYGRSDLLQMRSNAETGTVVRLILPSSNEQS